jgi:hypothetical protein
LCGVSLDAKKESLPKRRGLFGVVRAVKGVAEAQARGELHLHWLVWAMFGPLFYGRWVHTGEGLARIRDYLDRVVSGMAPVTEEGGCSPGRLPRGLRRECGRHCRGGWRGSRQEKQARAPEPLPEGRGRAEAVRHGHGQGCGGVH